MLEKSLVHIESILSGFQIINSQQVEQLPTDYYLFPLQVRTDSVAKLAYLDSLDVFVIN